MKKITLLFALILAGYYSFAQDCGSYIELVGSGITGQSSAIIQIQESPQIDSIVAEVIYKSLEVPGQVKLWTVNEENLVDPVDVPINGFQGPGVITSVYRATFKASASEINLDILENSPHFYSMAVYVYRKNGHTVSHMEGELYHVYQNEDDPLMTVIPVQTADHPRDITLRFGITELNMDDRWAEFAFEANGEIKSLEIWEWDPDVDETDSYTIREVSFENVPGDIDQIKMTMLSENHVPDTLKGDSFIAGVVLVDVPCEYEEYQGYCSYTQGYYGNEGGKTCKGETTRELLGKLLMEDLIMGDGDYSFTIPAHGVDCVLDILPGGGPSQTLSGAYSCSDLGDIPTNKQGRLKNTLLAQGITLALNLRNSPDLEYFPVDGLDFQTRKTENCMDPESGGIHGTENYHAFSMELVDYMGPGATIGDLLYVVNMALAGYDIAPLSLSEVAGAAGLVNEAFDECVVVVKDGDMEEGEEGVNGEDGEDGEDGDEGDEGDENSGYYNEDGTMKGATGISPESFEESLSLYPNPTRDLIKIQTGISRTFIIEISTLKGQIIQKDEFTGTLYQADLASLKNGVYFLKISSEDYVSTRKIVKQ